ncbi:prepilin-type N-terminal cleavage/methylation domain-containing protein [Candidatus Pelagibacter bacterium]|jgi:prepilin-type N-terminal cleavage/methylation domain-containing protein|nr:prepilin-type N-terminal cleavage/methylation domain-containing protein [Candidatus Pelagibacter bacterium]
MIKNRAFTILELLVVLAVIGVFSAIAYPNVSSWIADRNVKNAAFETVAFVKDRKSEVTSGKYGMTQILFNRQLQVFTMSPNKFIEIYKSTNSPFSSHKQNYTCGFGDTAGFTRQNQYDKEDFGPYVQESDVHIYPSAWHNPTRTAVCITKDGSISYYRPNQNGRIKDQSTGQMVDFFLFCSKSNSTERSCKYNSNLEYRYMITLDRFQNMKVFRYNKSKNKWNKVDG